jgi:hypothetical protein
MPIHFVDDLPGCLTIIPDRLVFAVIPESGDNRQYDPNVRY